LDKIIQSELTALIKLKRAGEGPFNPEVINNYYNKYLEIMGKDE